MHLAAAKAADLKWSPERFSRAALERVGLTGWLPFPEAHNWAECPPTGGVYLVSYGGPHPGIFPDTSPAGRPKGKDPTVDLLSVTSNWVAYA